MPKCNFYKLLVCCISAFYFDINATQFQEIQNSSKQLTPENSMFNIF